MEGCTEIGNGNFQDHPLLESVVLPESVTEIRKNAFWFCESLWDISLPGGLTEIGALAFNQVPQVYYSDPLGTGYDWGAFQIN